MFPTFSKIWLINISLAVFVVILGIMSFNVWLKADETIPEIQTGKSSEKPLAGKMIIERTMPPDSTYGIVADKNLFSSNRVEVIPEKQKPGPPKISEKLIFLYGVVLTGDLKQALISNHDPGPAPGKKPAKDKWVKVGDTMGGFSVADIRKDRIVLAEGASTHEILLYDKNKPARQTTVAEKQAAPTVVAAVPAAAAAKPGTEPPKSVIAEGKGTSEAEYITINTPFGPTRRRVK